MLLQGTDCDIHRFIPKAIHEPLQRLKFLLGEFNKYNTDANGNQLDISEDSVLDPLPDNQQ